MKRMDVDRLLADYTELTEEDERRSLAKRRRRRDSFVESEDLLADAEAVVTYIDELAARRGYDVSDVDKRRRRRRRYGELGAFAKASTYELADENDVDESDVDESDVDPATAERYGSGLSSLRPYGAALTAEADAIAAAELAELHKRGLDGDGVASERALTIERGVVGDCLRRPNWGIPK